MVKNMKDYNKLKLEIEGIFNSLDISYSILDFQDSDLNYNIQINTIGKLKPLNSITCVLYLCLSDTSINLIVGNIYRIYNDNNLLLLYEAINNINMSISNGNFILTNDTPKQIFYKSSMNCGNEFLNLDDKLVATQINTFVSALESLLDSLKNSGFQK